MPDLLGAVTRGRNLIVSVLIDDATVTADPDLLDITGYDSSTMRATTSPDPTTVWTGKCLVLPANAPETPIAPQTPIAVGHYRALLPYDVPAIGRGNVLTLTTSQDPQLQNVPLYVHAVIESSVNVARVLDVAKDRPR